VAVTQENSGVVHSPTTSTSDQSNANVRISTYELSYCDIVQNIK